MVLLGGLEVLAAGYLYHKHEQNKKERQRLAIEDAAIEEEIRRLEDKRSRRKSSSPAHLPAYSAATPTTRPERTSSGGGQTAGGIPTTGSTTHLEVPTLGGRHGRHRRESDPGRRPRREHSATSAPSQPQPRPMPTTSATLPYRPAPPHAPVMSPAALHPAAMMMSPPAMMMSPPATSTPLSPPPAYEGVVTGIPANWTQPGPNPAAGLNVPIVHTPLGTSAPAAMAPHPAMLGQAAMASHPPMPGQAGAPPAPVEYGWKPGVTYPEPPTETPSDREARKARRRERRRLERTRSEAGVSNTRDSPSQAQPRSALRTSEERRTPREGRDGNNISARQAAGVLATGLWSGIEKGIASAREAGNVIKEREREGGSSSHGSSNHNAKDGSASTPTSSSSAAAAAAAASGKPYQRVRFTGMAEGMETRNRGPRYETVYPGQRAHRWESGGGGGGGDCGGGGGGGGGGC